MNAITQDDALKWVAGLFNEDPDTLKPETPREDVAEWDSLGVLTLMAELDEKFGIVLTDEESQGMTSVNDLLELLRKHGNLNS